MGAVEKGGGFKGAPVVAKRGQVEKEALDR